jgi:uncharacterized HAD superfamily protein
MHNRVGLDIDGVFADYHTAIHEETMKRHGEVTKETLHRTECSILDTYNYSFWRKIKPLDPPERVKMFLEEARNEPCTTLYFLTRRPPCLQYVTAEWLTRHFINVNHNVILVTGAVEKGRIAQGLLLDHFVDDDPVHCMQVMRYSPKTFVWLADRPGNRWFTPPEDMLVAGGDYDR